jgi:hypothetical protein
VGIDRILWGLIIQGPTISYGQGPNVNKEGFNSIQTIFENIKNFIPFVNKIVISTWDQSNLNLQPYTQDDRNIFLIESITPKNSYDNRLKQFISTYAGVNFIKNNFNDVTHVLKIRTDQLIDPNLIKWLTDIYLQQNISKELSRYNQEDKIIFSDSLISTSFYLGDFIFAGRINDIYTFCKANLLKNNIHPTIGIDYILKYLKFTDKDFYQYFFSNVPITLQISNNKQEFFNNNWHYLYKNRFLVMPQQYFDSIVWRGKKIIEIIPTYKSSFQFFEEWLTLPEPKVSKNKRVSFLMFNKSSLIIILYIYKVKVKNILNFYIKKNG